MHIAICIDNTVLIKHLIIYVGVPLLLSWIFSHWGTIDYCFNIPIWFKHHFSSRRTYGVRVLVVLFTRRRQWITVFIFVIDHLNVVQICLVRLHQLLLLLEALRDRSHRLILLLVQNLNLALRHAILILHIIHDVRWDTGRVLVRLLLPSALLVRWPRLNTSICITKAIVLVFLITLSYVPRVVVCVPLWHALVRLSVSGRQIRTHWPTCAHRSLSRAESLLWCWLDLDVPVRSGNHVFLWTLRSSFLSRGRSWHWDPLTWVLPLKLALSDWWSGILGEQIFLNLGEIIIVGPIVIILVKLFVSLSIVILLSGCPSSKGVSFDYELLRPTSDSPWWPLFKLSTRGFCIGSRLHVQVITLIFFFIIVVFLHNLVQQPLQLPVYNHE